MQKDTSGTCRLMTHAGYALTLWRMPFILFGIAELPRSYGMNFSPPSKLTGFFSGNIQDWLVTILRDSDLSLSGGIAIWLLWKARNEDIFEGKLVTSAQLRLRVHSWITGVRETMKTSSQILSKVVSRRRETLIEWIPAPDEWITVNTDGSIIQLQNLAAGGGVLRNWRVEFTHTYREGNRVADLLAHLGHSLAIGRHSIVDCNPEIRLALFGDCIGVASPRAIYVNN
ncbi:hypothetical protein LINPERHAP1_LOCUS35964 [Linum perenne]